MKKIISIIGAALFFTACTNSSPKSEEQIKNALADSANFTTVQWLDSLIDFGSIKQGDTTTVKFHCKNTGSKPLILINVKPTCGCTVANYTKEPIAPGGEGIVVAVYNSGHSCGTVHKTIIATANTKKITEYYLTFTGTVTNCESIDKVVLPHALPGKKQVH